MKQTKNGVTWDDTDWPEARTKLIRGGLPADLKDLWDQYPDQAQVFVAEAIIQEPPVVSVILKNPAQIELLMWEVAGDCLYQEEPLGECIENAIIDYDKILYEDQREEVAQQLASLEALETTIQDAKKYLIDMLKAYDNEQTSD